ncbi:serine/threonine-protein kinase [Povalibacter uvarum]|uniref:Serine/threonine-protein kinase n=1 Tax=Povalibacter uvarum TaxID=732238 RepID=A0A841HSB3_9GAMM|nr:serine/threonine-protein kinase [Povalibacter uvarum]MBB6094938.1 serine/threonine-protein kinase [Povalibacter uvarum]
MSASSPAPDSVRQRPATRLWVQALAHLDELLQQQPEQRERSLTDIAQSQPHLHSMLVSLLAAEAQAESAGFLEPAPRMAAALQSGAQLGPYRVESQIGAGGMGEVWLARRDDGLYQGEVAIKTLHPYYGGGALRERFLREAQILSRLTHPNIARLLDAGVAGDGSVYLVLEYVRGVSIETWCDQRKLGVDARLELFLEVCAAVAQAHASLVVHRDIKPSNILVTDDGQVKLLDFGVAKLTQTDPPAERSDLTRMTGRIFTPEYAAPEQILDQPITTATDVYSLGVLLNVLLTGTRPYGNANNNVEIERAVVQDEPVRMSRAIAGASDPRRIAEARSTTPARLQRALTGDLDNIVSHALRKAPAERYPTVLGLADDVGRHLQHQPILARAESLAARSRKFVRRHRVGVAASVFVALAVGVGIAGVVWQAQVARTEARKAGAIRDFLVGIFERNSVAHPDGAKARQTTAAELLAQSAQQIRTDLREAPEVRQELLGVMARLYSTMDMQKDALPLLQDRLASQRTALGNDDVAVARTLSDVAFSQVQIGDYEGAQRSANEAIEVFHARNAESALEYALAHGTLAQVSYRLGTGQDGTMRRHYQKAADLFAQYHPAHKWRIEMLLGLSRAANLDQDREKGLVYAEEAIALIESQAVDADGIVRGSAYQTAGNALNWLGRNGEAEVLMKRAITEYDHAGGPEHPFAIEGRRELGAFYGWMGRREEAKELLAAAVTAQERAKGIDDPELTAPLRIELGRVLLLRGEYAAAEPQLLKAVEAWRRSGTPTVGITMNLARMYMEQGRFTEAAQMLAGADSAAEKAFGKGSWMHATALNRIGGLHLARGETREAEAYFQRTRADAQDPPGELGANRAYAELSLLRLSAMQRDSATAEQALALLSQIESSSARGDMPDEEVTAHMLSGIGLMRQGKLLEAETHLKQAVTMRERMDAPESLWLAEARLYLAQQQYLAGNRDVARGLVDRAAEAHQTQAHLGPQHRELMKETRRIVSF